MKLYKGFNKDMTCRGFQFEEGKTYTEDKAKLCHHGFHACEDPLDCFEYYEPGSSVYHEVELEEVSDKRASDTKRVGKKITIGAELNVLDICKAHFDFTKSIATSEKHGGEYRVMAGRDRSVISGGEYRVMAGRDRSVISGGDRSVMAGSDESAIYGGDRSVMSCGDRSAISGGDRSVMAGSYGSAIYCGNRSAAVCFGSASVGLDGCALVRGKTPRAKGDIGAVLVLCEEDDNRNIGCVKAITITGKTYKPDTWYTIRDGKVVKDDG